MGCREDFSAISPDSPTHDYSRAYLYHLHEVRELLGTMLLVQHNLYVYAGFFAAIRKHIRAGTFTRFVSWFLRTQIFQPPAPPQRSTAGSAGFSSKKRKAQAEADHPPVESAA